MMSGEHGSITVPATQTREAAAGHAALEADLQQLRNLLDAGDVEGARRLVNEMEVRWPDSEPVRHYAHVLAPPKVRMRDDIKARPMKKEWEWLRQHAHEYPGCWLALLEDRLVAADPDGLVVRAKAREIPGEERPLIYYQPDSREHK
jgi:uncharacterized protein DUF5678